MRTLRQGNFEFNDRLLALADRVVEMVNKGVSARPCTRSRASAGRNGLVQTRRGLRSGLRLYAVSEGEVEILRELAGGGQQLVRVAKPGDYFGELGPLFGLRLLSVIRLDILQGFARVGVRRRRLAISPSVRSRCLLDLLHRSSLGRRR